MDHPCRGSNPAPGEPFGLHFWQNKLNTQENLHMTKAETTAEGFVAVLKALPKSERDAVIVRIAQDEEFRLDLVDLAIVAERAEEPSRPFNECLREKRGR